MNVVKFEEEEVAICKEFMRFSYVQKDLAKKLLAMLCQRNIISVEDTFITVKSNVPLMNAITNSIVLGLYTTIEGSRYGFGVVSDFDLHVNMSTDSQFNDFLSGINFDRNRPEYTKLKSNRANLRRYICRVKNAIVNEFELPESPDTRETKASPAKKCKTDVMMDLEANLNTATPKKDEFKLLDDEAEEYVKRKDRGLITDSPHSTNTTGEEIRKKPIPVTSNFQIAPIELAMPNDKYQDVFVTKLSSCVNELTSLLSDFKNGTTLMLKFNSATNNVYIACTDANEWVHYEYTTELKLTNNKTNYESESMDDEEFPTSSKVESLPVPKVTRKLSSLAPPSKFNGVLCQAFKNGTCEHGDNCKFSHSG